MRNLSLNQSRVDRLKPRNSTYDIRDTDLKGFGIRVLPSGRESYFLQTQHEGQRRWTKIGDADATAEAEAEARLQARSLLAGIRNGLESPYSRQISLSRRSPTRCSPITGGPGNPARSPST